MDTLNVKTYFNREFYYISLQASTEILRRSSSDSSQKSGYYSAGDENVEQNTCIGKSQDLNLIRDIPSRKDSDIRSFHLDCS